MCEILTLIIGFLIGFFLHLLAMKINFKNKVVENKIQAYAGLISSWVEIRNEIYNAREKNVTCLDRIYGASQKDIGNVYLVTDDQELADELNKFNENFYRQRWVNSSTGTVNKKIEGFKDDAIHLIKRMQKDIKKSSALTRGDIVHALRKIFCCR